MDNNSWHSVSSTRSTTRRRCPNRRWIAIICLIIFILALTGVIIFLIIKYAVLAPKEQEPSVNTTAPTTTNTSPSNSATEVTTELPTTMSPTQPSSKL